MGKIIGEDDVQIPALFALMNERFAPSQDYPPKDPPVRCDGICEMQKLQDKFKFFQRGTGEDVPTFRECAALLNLGGRMPWSLRQKWYKYLDHLNTCDSDDPPKKGGQRIVHKVLDNLEAIDAMGRPKPKPIFFEPHKHANMVLVEERALAQSPLFYIQEEYSVIKLPMLAHPWPDKS